MAPGRAGRVASRHWQSTDDEGARSIFHFVRTLLIPPCVPLSRVIHF
jgi:hypothetical protein